MNPKTRASQDKCPLHLCPPAALRGMAWALKTGADKYGAWDWRGRPQFASVGAGALLRHITSWLDGEDVDPESGLGHLDHILAGAAILRDAAEHGCMEDDRP